MSLYVSPGYIRTSEAVDRLFEARSPEMADGASARQAELQSLLSQFRAEFAEVGAPPARLADAIHSRNAEAEQRAAIWLGAEEHEINLNTSWDETPARLAEARHKANLLSQAPAPTFTEDNLARLHELERIAQDQRGLRDDAAIELRSALAEGRLNAFLSGKTSRPIDMSRWHDADSLTWLLNACLGRRAVVIKEADFVAWLHSGSEATGAPVCAPSPSIRPKATVPALTKWFEDRVAAWPDTVPAPSERVDVAAAFDHFAPGLSRDDVRSVRVTATPRQWRTQGPRRPWGDVKPNTAV
jgi:hypothetical protein